MAWNLSGKMVESCTCNMLCPCWFGVKELMVMAVDFPGPTVLDGNATARLYIDDGANSNQQKELEDIFQGRKGGPMAMIAQLASKWLPTQKTKIEVNDDGANLTATVGNFGQIKSQQLKNESGNTMVLQGAGFASAFQMENETFTLAPSASQWSDGEMPHPQVTTKSGVVAKFSWRGN